MEYWRHWYSIWLKNKTVHGINKSMRARPRLAISIGVKVAGISNGSLNLLVHAATAAIAQWAGDIKGMRMGILIVLHTSFDTWVALQKEPSWPSIESFTMMARSFALAIKIMPTAQRPVFIIPCGRHKTAVVKSCIVSMYYRNSEALR